MSATNNVVVAFGMTHTPGLGDQMDRLAPAQRQRLLEGFGVAREEFEKAEPDVVVVFTNDHFDMFTTENLPAFAISVGDTHWGPTPETEAWIQMQRAPVPGHSSLAMDILQSLMEDGIELHRTESAEFVHNVLLPKKYLWPDREIPVVPIFVNAFIPPMPTFARAYELGKAVRHVLDRRSERVALVASGGVSHWPPIVFDEDDPSDPLIARVRRFNRLGRQAWADDPTLAIDIIQREKEMAASGRELINVGWDREILQRLAHGDTEYLLGLRHPEIRAIGGPGASEMLMWASLLGAMNGAASDIVMYEPVVEFMGGVALTSYRNI